MVSSFSCPSSLLIGVLSFLHLSSFTTIVAQNSAERGYLDRFTYQDSDIVRPDLFTDYSPSNWDDISCDEGSRLEDCLAYPDKWETGRGWKITKNYCRWCPESDPGRCSRHHQSPIDLKREFGLPPGAHVNANECIGTLYAQTWHGQLQR
jgi:hypothetical protein